MAEQQRPDWVKGLVAVAVALLIIGAVMRINLLIMGIGALMLLFVGVATAGQHQPQRNDDRPPPPEPGSRPWRDRGQS